MGWSRGSSSAEASSDTLRTSLWTTWIQCASINTLRVRGDLKRGRCSRGRQCHHHHQRLTHPFWWKSGDGSTCQGYHKAVVLVTLESKRMTIALRPHHELREVACLRRRQWMEAARTDRSSEKRQWQGKIRLLCECQCEIPNMRALQKHSRGVRVDPKLQCTDTIRMDRLHWSCWSIIGLHIYCRCWFARWGNEWKARAARVLLHRRRPCAGAQRSSIESQWPAKNGPMQNHLETASRRSLLARSENGAKAKDWCSGDQCPMPSYWTTRCQRIVWF